MLLFAKSETNVYFTSNNEWVRESLHVTMIERRNKTSLGSYAGVTLNKIIIRRKMVDKSWNLNWGYSRTRMWWIPWHVWVVVIWHRVSWGSTCSTASHCLHEHAPYLRLLLTVSLTPSLFYFLSMLLHSWITFNRFSSYSIYFPSVSRWLETNLSIITLKLFPLCLLLWFPSFSSYSPAH